MNDRTFLNNQFLIAMPALADPNFYHSVTYVCEHHENGAMGIVINQPMNLTLGDILEQLGVPTKDPKIISQPVFVGGPVQQDRGFVIHTPGVRYEATVEVNGEIAITTSRDILQAIAESRGPEKFLVSLGYAGWGPVQLEEEMAQNSWLCCPADPRILFDTPPELRWHSAAALVGVDIHQISGEAGHA